MVVGLAAPQVHEGVRLFVAALEAGDDEGDDSELIAVINPEITIVGADVVEDWEECLSIPDIRGRVPRAREIKVRALDRTGARIELNAHDFPARVIQHETDHLDGVLFFDRMTSLASMTFLDEFSRYWRKTDDDEPTETETAYCFSCRAVSRQSQGANERRASFPAPVPTAAVRARRSE